MPREIVCDLILADFAFELIFGVAGIVDDRSYLPVNRAGLVKDVANDFHIVVALNRCVANGSCHPLCARRESADCKRRPLCPDTRRW